MYGVVLWSDQNQNRAVIWCEDHGNLAFFNGEADSHDAPIGIEPGDLVQFDVQERRNMRLARNVFLVSCEEYPTLAQDLRQAGREDGEFISAPLAGQSTIVPFNPGLCSNQRPHIQKRSAV